MSSEEKEDNADIDIDEDIDISDAVCVLCVKKCSIWSILEEKYIFLGIWDFSTHQTLTFCSEDCRKRWLK